MFTASAQLKQAFVNPTPAEAWIGDSNDYGAFTLVDGSGPAAPYLATNPKAVIGFRQDFIGTGATTLETYSSLPGTFNRAPGYTRPSAFPIDYGWDAAFVKTFTAASAKKLAIFKFGISGSTLIARLPSEPAREWQKSSAGLYNQFIAYYKATFELLRQQGSVSVNMKRIVIQLFTNDAFFYNASNNYTLAVQTFVANLRTDLGLPNVPIYWIQIRTDLQTRPIMPLPPAGSVAALQQVLINCATVGNAAYIPGFNLVDNYQSLPMQSDGTHFTDVGYNAIGLDQASIGLSL